MTESKLHAKQIKWQWSGLNKNKVKKHRFYINEVKLKKLSSVIKQNQLGRKRCKKKKSIVHKVGDVHSFNVTIVRCEGWINAENEPDTYCCNTDIDLNYVNLSLQILLTTKILSFFVNANTLILVLPQIVFFELL